MKFFSLKNSLPLPSRGVGNTSVADPEWFIVDPNPGTNFLSFDSNPYYFSIFENYKKYLKFNQKEESTNCLPFSISYYTVQSDSTHSLEFTGIKLKILLLFIGPFFFCWIQIRNNNSISGSGRKRSGS